MQKTHLNSCFSLPRDNELRANVGFATCIEMFELLRVLNHYRDELTEKNMFQKTKLIEKQKMSLMYKQRKSVCQCPENVAISGIV
jgi:predicted aldo/keto reductase-like oxidoreductase